MRNTERSDGKDIPIMNLTPKLLFSYILLPLPLNLRRILPFLKNFFQYYEVKFSQVNYSFATWHTFLSRGRIFHSYCDGVFCLLFHENDIFLTLEFASRKEAFSASCTLDVPVTLSPSCKKEPAFWVHVLSFSCTSL